MTKVQQIAEMLQGDDVIILEEAETEVRQATLADVLIDLKTWADTAEPGEKSGLLAAIEIIKANYGV